VASERKIIPFPRRAPAPPAPSDARGLVEVYRCNPAEAVVVKSLFESEAIPVLLRSRLVSSLHPFTVGDQGEVTVLVPEREALRSRRLLARIAAGPSFP
jgi:hypothetical protein